jgi:hypothetical protein
VQYGHIKSNTDLQQHPSNYLNASLMTTFHALRSLSSVIRCFVLASHPIRMHVFTHKSSHQPPLEAGGAVVAAAVVAAGACAAYV